MATEAASPKPRRLVVLLPLVLFLGLAALFLTQLLSGRDVAEIPSALIGQPAPHTSLPPLDGILRNLNVRTLLFAGVNTDQCVMCSLQDANFLGYGCVLLEDCCATTSPDFCSRATIWNVKKCFGFVSSSKAVLDALAQVM